MAGVQKDKIHPGEAAQAAAEVFERHGRFIRAIIHIHAPNRSEEEDLFQEFFLVLIRKPMPPDVENVNGYLYRAISNHVVDSVRARRSYDRATREYARRFRIRIYNEPAGNALLEDTEEYNANVARFLEHLRDREAEAFVLRYRDHYSVREIAAVMGVTARTVSRYLTGSVRKLRRKLATSR